MFKVLLVDDDERILRIAKVFLSNKYECFSAKAFDTALLLEIRPDILILDWLLPTKQGIDIIRSIRKSVGFSILPIIMISGKGHVFEKIKGLEAGADDYLSKPFELAELAIRIETVLRRSRPQRVIFDDGEINIHVQNRTVSIHGRFIAITAQEWTVLEFLLNTGRVVSRKELAAAIWGNTKQRSDRTVDRIVARLRQKLHLTAKPHRYIFSERGQGYSFHHPLRQPD